MNALNTLQNKWNALTQRERFILGAGAVTVVVFVLYQFIYTPAVNATTTMQNNVSSLRSNLVWLQEQAKSGVSREASSELQGDAVSAESLVAILERAARAHELEGSIQQLTPGDNDNRVRVVMDGASFNNWIKWVVVLEQQYGVKVLSATVERQNEPDKAEIRMEFERSL